jgi:hypothetical protein
MYQTPSRPDIRIRNYVTDWPVHNKRWIRTFVPCEQHLRTPLPIDESAFSKIINPNWRRDWKEVLLFKAEPFESFRPIIWVNGKCYTTIFPVKGHLFTMRIGPDAVDVMLYGKSMQYSPIGFYDPKNMCRPLILGQSEMTTSIKDCGQKVTRV